MALFTDTPSFSHGITAAFDRARTALHTARARRAAYVKTYNELDGLNDRELNDLGISRADIDRIARSTSL